jgi:hypothetical protein
MPRLEDLEAEKAKRAKAAKTVELPAAGKGAGVQGNKAESESRPAVHKPAPPKAAPTPAKPAAAKTPIPNKGGDDDGDDRPKSPTKK